MSQSEFQIEENILISEEEKYKRPKKQMVYEDGVQQGSWNDQQHKKYLMFLNYHMGNKWPKGKKTNQKKKKLFKLMSQFIGTRNLLQCRSHHQKLELKYPTMKTLVEKEKKKYLNDGFLQQYRDLYQKIKEVYDGDKQSETNILNVEDQELISERKEVGCQTGQDFCPSFTVPYTQYGCVSNSIQLLYMNGLNGSPIFFVSPQTIPETIWQAQ